MWGRPHGSADHHEMLNIQKHDRQTSGHAIDRGYQIIRIRSQAFTDPAGLSSL